MRRWRRRAEQRAKGCFVLLFWSLTHFTFSHKGHDSTRRTCESLVCVCVCVSMQNTELLWRNGVSVCDMYSSVWLLGCVASLPDGVFSALFCASLYVSKSSLSVQMFNPCRVCVYKCVYERVWVIIGSQWVEQSSWPHFLLLLTERPEAPETRHCLQELPVTAAYYNHLICHCFDCFFSFSPFTFVGISQTVIQSYWTTRSGHDG